MDKPIINQLLDDMEEILQYDKVDNTDLENLRIYKRKLETKISKMQDVINDTSRLYWCDGFITTCKYDNKTFCNDIDCQDCKEFKEWQKAYIYYLSESE